MAGTLLDGAVPGGEEAVVDAMLWGLPEAEIASLIDVFGSGPVGDFAGVWPANRDTVDAFLVAASQWRTGIATMGGGLATLWVGLDYAGLAVALAAHGIELTGERLAGIQVMERAARAALNGGAA